MEVHKHPHHVTHKKKWGEYLLEFFMLFLAVFLGFIAENIRETITDNSKEKEYIISMIEDAKTDTSNIRQAIALNNNRVMHLDSLTLLCGNYNTAENMDAQMYRHYKPGLIHPAFISPAQRTIQQLKNAGGMRLIKNKADSVASYYQLISVVKTFRDEIQSNLQLTYSLSFKIFDQYSFDNNPKTPATLINNDAPLIKEYTNKLYNLASSLKSFQGFLETIKSKSINLDQLIRKEYDLQNE